MKKAIITGGTGMLGSTLIRLLCEKQIQVLVLVRPGSERIRMIPDSEYVTIRECDVNHLLELKDSIDSDYDAFFHFAWGGTHGDARDDVMLQNRNVQATLEAVELAHSAGCKTFLGAGSQAEYGRVDGIPLAPDTPVHPETGYGIGKLCAGQMSRILCRKYGIKHIWVRILSTYGPGDGLHTMVMSGIRQMIAGERPQYTKGEQMWDYLYCDDAARAFYLAAQKGRDGAVYPIGSGQVRPLAEYIRMIRDAVDPSIEIGFGEIPYYDKQVMYLCADIHTLTEDTGFVPEIPFSEGIVRTIKWYRETMI